MIEYQVKATLAPIISNSPPRMPRPPAVAAMSGLSKLAIRPPAVDSTVPTMIPGISGSRCTSRAVIAEVIGLVAATIAAETPLEKCTPSVVMIDDSVMPIRPRYQRCRQGSRPWIGTTLSRKVSTASSVTTARKCRPIVADIGSQVLSRNSSNGKNEPHIMIITTMPRLAMTSARTVGRCSMCGLMANPDRRWARRARSTHGAPNRDHGSAW